MQTATVSTSLTIEGLGGGREVSAETILYLERQGVT